MYINNYTGVKMKKYTTIKTIIFLSIIWIGILFIPSVYAESVNISLLYKNENSITWQYSNNNSIITASIDGVIIEKLDNSSPYYTLNDVSPNSFHVFCVNLQCNGEITNSIIKSSGDKILDNILIYFFIILAVLFIIAAFFEPILGFVAFIFGIITLSTSINYSFEFGIIAVIILIASILVSFRKKD